MKSNKLIHCKRYVPVENPVFVAHRKACHFLMTHKDWTLCHGYLVSNVEGQIVKKPHAWCENGRRIMDPRFDTIMQKNLKLGFKDLEAVNKYSYLSARAQMRKHHRYSRWEEKWDFGFWKYQPQ